MRIIFFGTPEYALKSLEALAQKHDIAAVVTQPDKPSGRGNKLQKSPVKLFAEANGIPVLQPERLRNKENKEILERYEADIFIVAAYGQILRKFVLDLPRHGCINVHASVLPKYRGSAPIHRAIMNGETETGTTIMKMDRGIDTGDIICTETIPIGEKETYGELLNRLSNLGAGCIIRALDNISNWTFTPQDNENATYAPMLHRDDCRINWADSAQNIVNHIRGLNPDPSAFAIINGKPRKIYEADTQGEGIIVRDGLVITKLRAESGKIISGIDFLRGNTIESIE